MMNKPLGSLIKFLIILSLPIFFVSSCVMISQPLFRKAQQKYKYSVDKDIPPDFPVLVLVRDPKVNGFKAHVVYYQILDKFIQDHPDFTYLVPQGEQDSLRKRIQKEPHNLWLADFKVRQLSEGKQWLEVIGRRDDDRPNTGWYEAADKRIVPKFYMYYFGPRIVAGLLPVSFGLTVLLWGMGIGVYLAIKKNRGRKAAMQPGGR